MRKFIMASCMGLLIHAGLQAQATDAQNSLNEIAKATTQYQRLWNRNLTAPILLVDTATRRVTANYPDTAGILKPDGVLFSGALPVAVNMANTAVEWGGRRWAMILLPLPADTHDRLNLLAHELFHAHQPQLGFTLFNPANNHLDQSQGRTYLRLELEALLQAVQADEKTAMLTHLQHALAFRRYRQSLYPGSDSTENQLELNEGIAEYTGMVMSGRSQLQTREHFAATVKQFFAKPSFVRSFAYHTLPMYGYLLSGTRPAWNKDISNHTNLTAYFARAFAVEPLTDVQKAVSKYNGDVIIAQEKEREERQLAVVAGYKKLFVEQPHFDIAFEKMNVAFDPGNIVPLENKGTVYPNMRISDTWGILTVSKGALMAPDWSRVTLTTPVVTETNKISGDGWTIDLNSGYHVIKNAAGNFQLTRK